MCNSCLELYVYISGKPQVHKLEWALFIIAKPFKFFVSSTTHIRKLAARANRKLKFYGMRPELWWYSLYSKPMEEVSYVSQL